MKAISPFKAICSIAVKDNLYPEKLSEINKPPQVVYYLGSLVKSEKCVAVVGSRTPTAYGKQAAIDIANGLISAGVTIVSGLAPGIDTIAHQAAVKAKKRTIAVLGTGLDGDSIYPQENLKLAEDIVNNNGCLISEYPAKTAGSRFTFPRRNRIISGLSLGVVVIEAKERSGALITADWARKQQRLVWAVPGSIYSPLSKGTNWLIKQRLGNAVNEANDILKIIGLASLVNNFPQPLDSTDKMIVAALGAGPLTVDEIIVNVGLRADKIISALSILEINGMVNNLGNGMYGLNTRI
jgi:DNA processing protein